MVATKPIQGEELALAVAGYADEMQADDIVILDLRGLSSITDFFVLCSGTSTPHLKAIRREVAAKLAEDHEVKARATDGSPESKWVVLDFVDVILHIFHAERRGTYALEDLWSDAARLPFQPSGA